MTPDEIRITSPTGMGERNDPGGFGFYGAKRGKSLHKGRDYKCVPGQDVVCPIKDGKIVREANPYVNSSFKGVLIQGQHIAVKLFYVNPWAHKIGKYIKRGESFGDAQDISQRYEDVTPHIHLQIDSLDPEMLEK